jgi:hypothetical protein
MKKNILYSMFLISLALIGTSCSEDWLETEPSDSLTVEGSINNVTQVKYAVDGIYNNLTSSEYYNSDMIAIFDVMGDDMRASETGRLDNAYAYDFYTESSTSTLWSTPYEALKDIAALMNVIDNVETEGATEEAKLADLRGQALALRALVHFDLVRIFGKPYTHTNGPSAPGVTIVTEPIAYDALLTRNTVQEVYDQVITDLKASIELLDTDDNLGHINQWAAKALLSRVYLYMDDNVNALSYAEDVINNSGYTLVPQDKYVSSWAENGMSEALFELTNSSEDNGGLESIAYLSDPNGYGQFVASDDFISLLSADADDVRGQMLAEDELGRQGRIMKYPGKPGEPSYTTNIRVIRLSEVYLNAAEAAIKEGNTTDATKYLNAVYERATGKTVEEADVDLDRVLLERRKELVAEGHRFFDLVRNQITIVRGDDYWANPEYKTVTMDNHKIIQPIPRVELDANPEMQQNPGYAE